MSETTRQDAIPEMRQRGWEEQTEHEAYPLVALKNIVVFPHNSNAITVAREKTVRAIEEAMMRRNQMLIASKQTDVEIVDPEEYEICTIGTLVEATSVQRQRDGTLQILLRGIQRVRLIEFIEDDPFFQVRVQPLTEVQHRGPQADSFVRHAINLFRAIRTAQSPFLSRRY